MTPEQQMARRVAEAAGRTERKYLRAEGADWIEAYIRSWQIEDEVYNFVLDAIENRRMSA